MSLSTRVIADSSVNCDQTFEIGKTATESITGKTYADIYLQRKYKVIAFSSSRNSAVRVRGQDINIDPQILWHRLTLLIHNNKDRELYFAFILVSEPTFKRGPLRKTQKAVMGAILKEGINNISNCPENALFLVDDEYLLHKVKWPAHMLLTEKCALNT